MQNENIKTKYNKKIAFLVELLIWILVFLFFALAIIFYNHYQHENYSRYQIFLQDVDGIIEGSPVRMLGMNVGYVKHLKFITNDLIYVDFVITNKGMTIPKGSTITVEANGLAGSKSIEIYVPKNELIDESVEVEIQQPRRLRYVLGLLNDMLNKIEQITYKCSYFSKELNIDKMEIKNNEPQNVKIQKLKDIENNIDILQKELDNFSKNIKRY